MFVPLIFLAKSPTLHFFYILLFCLKMYVRIEYKEEDCGGWGGEGGRQSREEEQTKQNKKQTKIIIMNGKKNGGREGGDGPRDLSITIPSRSTYKQGRVPS